MMNELIPYFLSAFLIIPLPAMGVSSPENSKSTNYAPLRAARTALVKGDYQTAEKSFQTLLDGEESNAVQRDAADGLLRTILATGRYAKVIDHGKTILENHPAWGDVTASVGTALTELGRYEAARDLLQTALKRNPRNPRATIAMIALAKLTGDRREQRLRRKLWSRWYRRGEVNDAAGLTATAAAVADYDPKSAWRVFHVALDVDSNAIEAGVRAGELAFERQAWPKAKRLFKDVLTINPKHPGALRGLATVAMAENKLTKVDALLDKALKVNPNLTAARRLKAQTALMSRDLQTANDELGEALAVNPAHPETLALMAASEDRAGNAAKRDEFLKRALAINPNYSMAYDLMSIAAARHHQPAQAVKWADQAIKLNPDDWLAHYQRGISLCRLGEEKPGHAALERSFDLNPYNIWAYNMLQVMDRDVKDYQFVVHDTEHFAIKTDRTETDAFRRELGDLLESSYAEHTKKYQVVPKGPDEHDGRLLVLVLPSREEFAARTVGLPGMIGVAGVCFGQLINMPSPNTVLARLVEAAKREMEKKKEKEVAPKNDGREVKSPPRGPDWRTVAIHEFLHVLTLQKTNYRIPRWFTEGISTYEEPDPNQHETMKTLVAAALDKNLLLPVEDMESGFIRPTYPFQVIVSYMHSALICQYIIEKHGFPTILKLLDLFAENLDTAAAIPKATGLPLNTFNQKVIDYVKQKVATYKRGEKGGTVKNSMKNIKTD